jgi:hypothetical protein
MRDGDSVIGLAQSIAWSNNMSTPDVPAQVRSDTDDEQLVREHDRLRDELAQLEGQFSHATGDAKAALQANIGETKSKMRDVADRAHAQAASLQQQGDAQIKALEQQRAQASADTKANIDARIAEARADHDRRAAKLQQARELTEEALAR